MNIQETQIFTSDPNWTDDMAEAIAAAWDSAIVKDYPIDISKRCEAKYFRKPLAGVCSTCGEALGAYDSKMVREDLDMLCAKHFANEGDALFGIFQPEDPQGYLPYSDG